MHTMKNITAVVACFLSATITPSVFAIIIPIKAVGPSIQGAIENTSPHDSLTMTSNQITVPNKFPKEIYDIGLYTVQPTLPDPFSHWTKNVVYQDSQGNGCKVSFAWEADTQSGVISATPLTANSYCSSDDFGEGSIILIGDATPPSKDKNHE